MLRSATGFVMAASVWVAFESQADAHCLGGLGIYHCCVRAACGDASTATTDVASSEHATMSRNRHGFGARYTSTKSPIRRMGPLSVRTRNGGIN